MNKFEITPYESMTVERLYYIYKSNEIFCKVLAKELAEFSDEQKCRVLKQYADECRKSFIELDYTREQIINKYIGDVKTNSITYTFNFDTHEVEYDL